MTSPVEYMLIHGKNVDKEHNLSTDCSFYFCSIPVKLDTVLRNTTNREFGKY